MADRLINDFKKAVEQSKEQLRGPKYSDTGARGAHSGHCPISARSAARGVSGLTLTTLGQVIGLAMLPRETGYPAFRPDPGAGLTDVGTIVTRQLREVTLLCQSSWCG